MKLFNTHIQWTNHFQWTEETITKQLKQINYLESKTSFGVLTYINNQKKSILISKLNNLDLNYNTALIFACQSSPDIVSDLLKQPSLDINNQNKIGQTALIKACCHNPELIPDLLTYPEIDINAQSVNGWTALMWFCFSGDINGKQYILDLLNNPEININHKDNDGWTALLLASIHNSELIPDLLNCSNIDINAKNEDGYNALMCACNANPQSIPKLLNHSNKLLIFLNNKKEMIFDFAKQCNNNSYKIIKDFIDNDKLKNNIQSINNKKPEKML